MASTIAAVTTGGGGVITTADSSGNLSLLSGATTVVAVTSAGASVTGTLAASGAVTASTTLAVTGAITATAGINAPNTFGFKNRIINGGMVIDQRNAGASVTPTDQQYTLDRYRFRISQGSKLTTQQSTTAPVGFVNSLLVTSSSAYSITSSDFFYVKQGIEGLNITDLAWGTANAKTVTLSFQVYSSLTGTFGGSLNNSDYTRSYPFSYTISSANTWTTISVTIAGDTAGTWLTTNGTGIWVQFGLGVGSTYSGTANAWATATYLSATGATSVVGTSGATFYITGVQLEKGSTATSFDFRDYGRELAMCQRYAQVIRSNAVGSTGFANLACISTTRAYGGILFEMQMRSSPSISFSAANTFTTRSNSGAAVTITAISASNGNIYSYDLDISVASGLVSGDCTSTSALQGTSGLITISAEL